MDIIHSCFYQKNHNFHVRVTDITIFSDRILSKNCKTNIITHKKTLRFSAQKRSS